MDLTVKLTVDVVQEADEIPLHFIAIAEVTIFEKTTTVLHIPLEQRDTIKEYYCDALVEALKWADGVRAHSIMALEDHQKREEVIALASFLRRDVERDLGGTSGASGSVFAGLIGPPGREPALHIGELLV
jgi:hypothetical protein